MPKKILVVDDSATIRQQVSLALITAGFDVVQAADGLDGLAQVKQHDDIAMVLCDVNMPRMNGIDMVEQLKSDGGRPDLHVLMLTTEGAPALVARAKKLGAKGWIVKPFKAELLVAAVRKLTAGA
jgi:two-component system chemotaxis response regulator CheY